MTHSQGDDMLLTEQTSGRIDQYARKVCTTSQTMEEKTMQVLIAMWLIHHESFWHMVSKKGQRSGLAVCNGRITLLCDDREILENLVPQLWERLRQKGLITRDTAMPSVILKLQPGQNVFGVRLVLVQNWHDLLWDS